MPEIVDQRDIGNVIRTRRKSRNILQEDLAEIAGISLRTLRDIEQGKANPELQTLLKIAHVLGMEMNLRVIT